MPQRDMQGPRNDAGKGYGMQGPSRSNFQDSATFASLGRSLQRRILESHRVLNTQGLTNEKSQKNFIGETGLCMQMSFAYSRDRSGGGRKGGLKNTALFAGSLGRTGGCSGLAISQISVL